MLFRIINDCFNSYVYLFQIHFFMYEVHIYEKIFRTLQIMEEIVFNGSIKGMQAQNGYKV